jgi:hypothetical protein
MQKENVKSPPMAMFDKIDSPRLVEYWELDPSCREVPSLRRFYKRIKWKPNLPKMPRDRETGLARR